MPDEKDKSAIQNPKSEILIAEDSPIQAEMLRRVLVKNGYSVLVAKDGAEGLAMAKEQKPRLVISDIMMPVMDGYEMCKAIKSDETLKDIPVILLTSLTDPEDVIKGLDAGADSYVTKPFDEKLILSKISSLFVTAQLSKADITKVRLNVLLGGIPQTIDVYPQHIFNLLSSTYENAVIQNRHLTEARDEVEKLNRQLQEKIFEVTASEKRFISLVQTIPDIIYRINIDGRFIFINNAVRGLGYKPEELIGEHFSRIILPADVNRVSRSAVLEGYKGRVTGDKDSPKLFDERRAFERKTGGLEVRLVKKGGELADSGLIEKLSEEVLVVEVNSSGMYEISKEAKRPEFIGTVGVIRDISDRKLLEAELIRYKDHLEELVAQQTADIRFKSFLLDNATDSIFVHDLEGNFAYVNEAAYKTRGYTKEELLTMPLQQLDAPEYAELIRPRIEALIKTGSAVFESAHIKKDGVIMPVEIHVQIVEIDGKKLVVSIVRDITERKKSEEALIWSEKQYKDLVNNAVVGIYKSNLRGDILFMNQALANMYEFESPDEMMSGGAQARYKNPEDRKKLIDGLLKNGRVDNFEAEMLTKTGKVKNVLFNATLEGDVLSEMVLDITERKKLDELLREYALSLEEEVKSRTKELDNANIALHELNKELEAFTYSASHDLKAPLRSIDGFSKVLLEDYSERLDEDGRNYLNRVRTASQHMGALIDDLLNLSRLSRQEMNIQTIDLNRIANEIAKELMEAEPGRQAQFVIAEGLKADADAHLIRIALENLLRNAWKFTSKQPAARIELGARQESEAGVQGKGKTVYFVKDNGVGFDMAYSDKLFKPFQRLHSPEEFPGSGIGLTIVSRIIRRHGGDVWAEGKVGQGATFYFTL